MKNKALFSSAAVGLVLGGLLTVITVISGCNEMSEPQTAAGNQNPVTIPQEPTAPALPPARPAPAAPTPSAVYFTDDISPAGLMAVYNALGQAPSGKVAVKLSIGEPVSNYLRPELIGELVQSLNATIVESNTIYGGQRGSTAAHLQVAKDHGYTAIANVDILDANGYDSLPIVGGIRLTKNFVGKNFKNYDYYVVLSHFKGHIMGGFGGAIKNISIGIASREGKSWIHSVGKARSGFTTTGVVQDQFLESMAEAGKSVVDHLNGKILFINVMNRLSIECDCFNNPKEPDMHDIGILSSLDPVALDKACVDLVYNATRTSNSDNRPLIKRMEDQHGIHTVDHGAAIGLGSTDYELINLNTGIREPKREIR